MNIFPKHPTTDAYYVNGSYTPWAIVGRDKRFSDAELAAEYHACRTHFERQNFNELSSGEDWGDEAWDRIASPMNTLYRFAQLPHFDE